jgi:sugar lactone lactonase YvrE
METLLDGLAMVEGARWHDGRLWFAHWGVGEVIAVGLDGRAEVVASGPAQMGWAFDWLPDGRLVTTGDAVRVGTTVLRDAGANEVVVDPRGHVLVDGIDGGFSFTEPGWIDLVSPDGTSRRVADDIRFPNGMVVTPDGSTLVIAESVGGCLTAFDLHDDGSLGGRRVWAEGLGPDGIAIDEEGGIWSQTADTFAHSGDPSAPAGAVVRVLDGGTVTHRVETPMPCFACAVGGGKLFLLCNEWEGIEKAAEVVARRSSRVFVVDLDDVPRV